MRWAARTETHDERVDRRLREVAPHHKHYQNWHRWFAWYPVPISQDEKVWLAFVERKYTWDGDVIRAVYDPNPIYRLPTTNR